MSAGAPPRLSVVVPTLDPGADLAPLLQALFTQEAPFPVEVLVVDSGTRPGGLAALGGRPVRRIDVTHFGHGRTRQLAAEAARGELVLFLSQDALPADRSFFTHLVATLDTFPTADAACARQRPRPDADAAVAARLYAAFPAGDHPALLCPPPGGLGALSPAERLRLARYDHVASIVRRSALLARPLADVPFGEDLRWALDTLQAGRCLAYCPAAQVIHSHRRSPWETWRRTRLEHQALRAWLGLHTVPDLATLLGGAGGHLRHALRRTARGDPPRDAWGEAGRLLAELLGQYQAGR